MKFTDDDLKRLNECQNLSGMRKGWMAALLLRLEVGEDALESLESLIKSYRENDLDGWEIELAARRIEAWRKAAGKTDTEAGCDEIDGKSGA